MLTPTALFIILWSTRGDCGKTNAFLAIPNPVTRSCSLRVNDFETNSPRKPFPLFGKSRKNRRKGQKQGRSKQFYDAMEDAEGEEKKESPESVEEATVTSNDDLNSSVSANASANYNDKERTDAMEEAQKRYNERPEVSTLIVDEETGTEVLAQGQKVMNVITRKAIKLSDDGPDARLAQMFPVAPANVSEKYRFDWSTIEVPDMVNQIKEACSVPLEGDNNHRGIPPAPSVASKAVDFVLANRDFLGYRMKKVLGRWTLHVASTGDIAEAKEIWNKLWINFLTLENYISAPFRQIMQDAEGRVGPNFGNLDIKSFCNGDLYERVGNYLVLKGMVAHWEKKVLDADYFENDPKNKLNRMRGDPKRFLKDSVVLFTMKECTQVCSMAQQMCKLFVETEELFADFPAEVVFLEEALKIKGGTALRKYMIDEFCPARGITPEKLRERMRRLYQQLENMQVDPYGDITFKVEQLYKAMAVGTADARDPYEKYLGADNLDPSNPAFFQTYTFNYPIRSLVRFVDDTYDSAGGMTKIVGPPPKIEDESSGNEGKDNNPLDVLTNIFDSFAEIGEKNLRTEPTFEEDNAPYTVPKERAIGRPHDMGWLEKLNAKEEVQGRSKEVVPGRIISSDE